MPDIITSAAAKRGVMVRVNASHRYSRRCCAVAAVALGAMLAAPCAAPAQDYPARAVKIIVPFPAGGTADVMPRIFSDWLSKKWGHPVVIENRTGAAGNIGAEAVAKADPDGYTLLAAPPPPLVINHNLYPRLGFDPTEFVPIVIMGRVPNALVVNANADVNEALREADIRERLAQLSAEPIGGTPQATAAYMREEVERWHKVIKAANVKLE